MSDSWERICPIDEVEPRRPIGRLVGTSGQDRDRVCVVDGPDGPLALLDRCPHRDISLSGGIVRDGTLICPGHFWRFDLADGRRTDRPSQAAVVYPTRVVDGWVEALLPAPEAPMPMREWLLHQAAGRNAPMSRPSEADPPPASSPEIGSTVLAGGIRTNYHDEGSGPPVVLVHGSGPGVSAWANWRLTMPQLAHRFRVLAPDVVGFGYTDRPSPDRYDLEGWTSHLVGFLDAMELDRVALVGNSFGGALALNLAARHPARVGRLVLMGSVGAPFDITPGLDAVWGFEPSLPAMRRLLDIFAHDRSLVNDDLARLRLAAATRPGVQEAYAAMFPAPRQAHVNALTVDDDLVRSIRVPTLIVHGRDDQVIPLSTSLHLLQLIGDSRLQVFGQCGHWVQIEHADQFNRLLLDFLGEPSHH